MLIYRHFFFVLRHYVIYMTVYGTVDFVPISSWSERPCPFKYLTQLRHDTLHSHELFQTALRVRTSNVNYIIKWILYKYVTTSQIICNIFFTPSSVKHTVSVILMKQTVSSIFLFLVIYSILRKNHKNIFSFNHIV